MKNKVVPFLDAPCIIRIFTFIYHQFKPTVLKYSIHSPHLWCLFSIGGSPSLGILAHLLRMVMEPKYCAFRRWLYTPIILWHGEPGSLGHIYIYDICILYIHIHIYTCLQRLTNTWGRWFHTWWWHWWWEHLRIQVGASQKKMGKSHRKITWTCLVH